MRILYIFLLFIFSLDADAQVVALSPVVSTGLTSPTDIKHAGDKRLFIVERPGTIKIIDSNATLLSTPFLNIVSRVKSGGEQGLLGLAFDPDFKTNNIFYVYYTRRGDSAIVVSRFYLTGNPNHCDSTTEKQLLIIYHPYSNHNGGALCFGPDNYLYIGTGDGGAGGDPGNRAQNLDSLLGKILRIDVSDSSVVYKIPPDNPYVGKPGRDEVWDYGFRNPWRISFDRLTGGLWIGDVGQNKYEEIDFDSTNTGAVNFGWRCYEGDSSYNLIGCGPASDYTFPVHAYDHSNSNCSVTGGYRYRGSRFPNFYGKYFYGDFCAGKIRYLTETSPGVFSNTITAASASGISTFGEDIDGELYVAALNNSTIYRICDSSCLTGVEEEIESEEGMTLYPNPNSGSFTISCRKEGPGNKVMISNLFGQKIFEQSNCPMQLEIKGLTQGLYFLKCQNERRTITKKFVVQ